ncbi:MAG: cytosolic protein [Desulfobacterium sp.]|nr:cytosolic protein [Desulfobacterium sp.]
MECNIDKNISSCNCSYEPCPRKGSCCDCLKYHLKSRELPGCCFPADAEKTYNRSFEFFASLVNGNKV